MIYKRRNRNTKKNKSRQIRLFNKKTRHKHKKRDKQRTQSKQHKHIKKRFNKPKNYNYKKHSYYLENNGKFPYWIQP